MKRFILVFLFSLVAFTGIAQTTQKYNSLYQRTEFFDSNRRWVEKWIAFQLVNNESKFVITDRFIYAYNRNNNENRF